MVGEAAGTIAICTHCSRPLLIGYHAILYGGWWYTERRAKLDEAQKPFLKKEGFEVIIKHRPGKIIQYSPNTVKKIKIETYGHGGLLRPLQKSSVLLVR